MSVCLSVSFHAHVCFILHCFHYHDVLAQLKVPSSTSCSVGPGGLSDFRFRQLVRYHTCFVPLKGCSCVTVLYVQPPQRLDKVSAGAADAVSVSVTRGAKLGDAKVWASPGDSVLR